MNYYAKTCFLLIRGRLHSYKANFDPINRLNQV